MDNKLQEKQKKKTQASRRKAGLSLATLNGPTQRLALGLFARQGQFVSGPRSPGRHPPTRLRHLPVVSVGKVSINLTPGIGEKHKRCKAADTRSKRITGRQEGTEKLGGQRQRRQNDGNTPCVINYRPYPAGLWPSKTLAINRTNKFFVTSEIPATMFQRRGLATQH